MEALFQALYSGVLYGSVYGLMALGLTLIWGALKMLNLAHGALYLVGGYVAWVAVTQLGLPVIAMLVLGVLGAAVAGLALHLLVVQPVIASPGRDNASLVAT